MAIEFINRVETGRLSVYQYMQEQAPTLVQRNRLKLKSIIRTTVLNKQIRYLILRTRSSCHYSCFVDATNSVCGVSNEFIH